MNDCNLYMLLCPNANRGVPHGGHAEGRDCSWPFTQILLFHFLNRMGAETQECVVGFFPLGFAYHIGLDGELLGV